jgi:hypothetical protein
VARAHFRESRRPCQAGNIGFDVAFLSAAVADPVRHRADSWHVEGDGYPAGSGRVGLKREHGAGDFRDRSKPWLPPQL